MSKCLIVFLVGWFWLSLEAAPFTLIPEITSKQIKLANYPKAFNPSLVRWKGCYLLSFRHLPHPSKLWISQIGLLFLDENLEPVGEPQILDFRQGNSKVPCQAEDVRLLVVGDKLFLFYNDNMEKINPTHLERRDMHMAEVEYDKGKFHVVHKQLLYHPKEYKQKKWQKNWSPFLWNEKIHLSYSINPHEVLELGEEGECPRVGLSAIVTDWKWGAWRGGTPAELVDGQYLAFFHSSCLMRSEATPRLERWHYFMGAYTFAAEPPFHLTSYTPYPLIGEGFYIRSPQEKRVIFPGGFVVHEDKIYIAYGKDDHEMWIAILDKSVLKQLMVPVEENSK